MYAGQFRFQSALNIDAFYLRSVLRDFTCSQYRKKLYYNDRFDSLSIFDCAQYCCVEQGSLGLSIRRGVGCLLQLSFEKALQNQSNCEKLLHIC